MKGIYRINQKLTLDVAPQSAFEDYLSRLMKLIPAEVLGVYMIGSGFIDNSSDTPFIGWSIICLGLVIFVRIKGTAGPGADQKAQPIPVLISSLAFIVYIYWLRSSHPDQSSSHHLASLMVLVFSFVVPYFYKGS